MFSNGEREKENELWNDGEGEIQHHKVIWALQENG